MDIRDLDHVPVRRAVESVGENSPTAASAGSQPQRPTLLPGIPVLRRSADSAQLGVDNRCAVVLDGLTDPQLRVLDELDGRYKVDELGDLVVGHGGRRADLHRLLDALAGAGLLTDAAADPARRLPGWLAPDAAAWTLGTGRPGGRALHVRRASTVAVHGSGRLGIAIACALAGSGVGRVSVLAEGEVQADDIGTGYSAADIGKPRSEAALTAVARCAPASDDSPARGQRAEPDLVVLADTIVPDPEIAAGLLSAGIPHLPAVAHGGRGVVGPLVLPGRSSCLHCMDLRRTAADPCWPTLSAQLCRQRPLGDLCTTLAVAAIAAGQVLHALGWAEAARWAPSVWGATVEFDSLRGQQPRVRWQPHPDCRCGAA